MSVNNARTVATSSVMTSEEAIVRATKETMRRRCVSSSQSSRNLKAPSRNCSVKKGNNSKHTVRHTS